MHANTRVSGFDTGASAEGCTPRGRGGVVSALETAAGAVAHETSGHDGRSGRDGDAALTAHQVLQGSLTG